MSQEKKVILILVSLALLSLAFEVWKDLQPPPQTTPSVIEQPAPTVNIPPQKPCPNGDCKG